jgi:NADH-quinone oxidoreductase subunit M
MLNHGISTGALFAIVGMLYERYHTREIAAYSGIARKLPIMAFFMVVFTFSSIGLPGLNGFAGEFLILLGMFQRAWTTAGPEAYQLKLILVVSIMGVVLGAWYMLYLVQRIFFGPVHEPAHDEAGSHHHEHPPVRDLSLREIAALAPLAVLALWIGLRPGDWLSRMEPTLREATTSVVSVLRQDEAMQPVASVQVSKSEPSIK